VCETSSFLASENKKPPVGGLSDVVDTLFVQKCESAHASGVVVLLRLLAEQINHNELPLV
jgi:hypothetical protein